MPLVFAGVVPHSPLLIPGVAKEHHALFSKTMASLAELAAELRAAQPDTVIILSPHMAGLDHALTIQVADHILGDLTEFGDPTASIRLPGAIGLAHRLKTMAEEQRLPVVSQTPAAADYAVVITSIILGLDTFQVPVLPLGVGHLSAADVLRLGALLNEFSHVRPERLALIATADLTRRKESGTANRRPTKEERTITAALTDTDPAPVAALIGRSKTCGIQPITALLASVQPHRSRGTIRSFEAPLGVGQMVADLAIGP